MKDSRTISDYMKKTQDGKYVRLEILDKLKPNNFKIIEGGRIQSSVFGTYSNIIVKISLVDNGICNIAEYALHPDYISLVAEQVLSSRLTYFTSPNLDYPEFFGKVYRTIFTNNQGNNIKNDCSILNIKYNDTNNSLIFGIYVGKGTLIKDELNRNDFKDFDKKNYLGISIPMEKAELLLFQVKEYLNNFRNSFMVNMLSGRAEYEKNCKTIFKDCVGDTRKIRIIEEKFAKLK